jgi:hypothetical protein
MSNHSRIAANVNDAYFTSPFSAAWCINHLKEREWLTEETTTLEPAVGAGALADVPGNVIATDITDHGYPGTVIEDYLTAPQRNVDLVLTNPPFGRMSSTAVRFFNKAALDADRIAFIVPATFRKASVIDKLHPYFWCVFNEDLPDQLFTLPDGSKRKVRTIFQMWERRLQPRVPIRKQVDYKRYFIRIPKPTPDSYSFRTQGASAGRILPGNDYSPASTAFLVGSQDRVAKHDWTTIASFTAGIPAIGLIDVAYGLHLEDQGFDIDLYLSKGPLL